MDHNLSLINEEFEVTVFVMDIITTTIGNQTITLLLCTVLPPYRWVYLFEVIRKLFELTHWHLNKWTGRVNMCQLGLPRMSRLQWFIFIFDLFQHYTPIVLAFVLEHHQMFVNMAFVPISERDG